VGVFSDVLDIDFVNGRAASDDFGWRAKPVEDEHLPGSEHGHVKVDGTNQS
jgi:hypothetical protein